MEIESDMTTKLSGVYILSNETTIWQIFWMFSSKNPGQFGFLYRKMDQNAHKNWFSFTGH